MSLVCHASFTYPLQRWRAVEGKFAQSFVMEEYWSSSSFWLKHITIHVLRCFFIKNSWEYRVSHMKIIKGWFWTLILFLSVPKIWTSDYRKECKNMLFPQFKWYEIPCDLQKKLVKNWTAFSSVTLDVSF